MMSDRKLKPEQHERIRRKAEEGGRLVLQGIGLNLGLAAVKFAGGVFGQSVALIADGMESALDALSSLLVWAGFRVAARPPDEDHPYEHGKAEPLAALAVAVFTFGAAGWIAVTAVRAILSPGEGPHPATLGLLTVVVVVKLWYSRRMKRAGEQTGSTALGAEAWHHYADAVTSGAAFVGITLAWLGGPAFAVADAWAALVACVVIGFSGTRIFNRALGDVMDTAVPKAFEDEVRRVALEVAGVARLDKCRVRKSGLAHIVEIHVEVDPLLTVRRGHEIAHDVSNKLILAPLSITDVMVHVEPAGREKVGARGNLAEESSGEE